ncbi:MAG: hypothetical protein JSS11_08690 [Verrucomicrobia bacterium]|nr:hypothetical protein [Verrucomicrobiota bacterium]
MPLRQTWRDNGTEPGFRPGEARVNWTADALNFQFRFHGRPTGNRARRLNERTWELGDIAEVFLQITGCREYWEFHVTPENQRLQLHWPPHGLAAFRAGEQPFETFLLGPEASLESTTTVTAEGWSGSLAIPSAVLGLTELKADQPFRTAVCRYDYIGAAEPVCSSTAPLRELAFHRPDAWMDLVLSPS